MSFQLCVFVPRVEIVNISIYSSTLQEGSYARQSGHNPRLNSHQWDRDSEECFYTSRVTNPTQLKKYPPYLPQPKPLRAHYWYEAQFPFHTILFVLLWKSRCWIIPIDFQLQLWAKFIVFPHLSLYTHSPFPMQPTLRPPQHRQTWKKPYHRHYRRHWRHFRIAPTKAAHFV